MSSLKCKNKACGFESDSAMFTGRRCPQCAHKLHDSQKTPAPGAEIPKDAPRQNHHESQNRPKRRAIPMKCLTCEYEYNPKMFAADGCPNCAGGGRVDVAAETEKAEQVIDPEGPTPEEIAKIREEDEANRLAEENEQIRKDRLAELTAKAEGEEELTDEEKAESEALAAEFAAPE